MLQHHFLWLGDTKWWVWQAIFPNSNHVISLWENRSSVSNRLGCNLNSSSLFSFLPSSFPSPLPPRLTSTFLPSFLFLSVSSPFILPSLYSFLLNAFFFWIWIWEGLSHCLAKLYSFSKVKNFRAFLPLNPLRIIWASPFLLLTLCQSWVVCFLPDYEQAPHHVQIISRV